MSKAADLANLIGNINAGGGGANKNAIINGAMNVAQRSVSEADVGGAGKYPTIDRFKIVPNGTNGRVTMSQDSSAPSGFANSLKLDVTTADTSVSAGDYFTLSHKMEGQNLQAFAKGTSDAKPFAVSFYVKGNASATYAVELFDSNSRQASKLFNVTTDWTRVELTFDPDTTGTIADDNAQGLELNFWLHAGTNFTSGTLNQTFAANNNTNRAVGISSLFDSTDRTFFLTGVQLEVGQNPTSFEHEPFETTEKKCQRYYEKHSYTEQYHHIQFGIANSTTQMQTKLYYRKQKRAAPTVTFSADGTFRLNNYIGADEVCNSITAAQINTTELRIQWAKSTGNFTAGDAAYVNTQVDNDATIELDSEL